MADLLPAVRLALGAAQPLEERFTWLRHAWGAVPAGTAARVAADVETLILDGELLVYQETETSAGQYDELGSKPGIQAFGTIHWLRQGKDGGPSNYGRSDARRHLMVKVFDVLFLNGVQTMEWPLSERRELLESGRCFVPIPHYLELSAAQRVDLGAPSRPLHVAFDDARVRARRASW